MFKKKFTAIVSLLLCLLIAFSGSAAAAQNENQFLSADSISITRQRGIIQGESIQLTAEVEPKSAAVEWYSSNPDVISCDKYGKIKGVKEGESATIFCKSKYGSVKSEITVYCVKAIYPEKKCSMKNGYGFIYSMPTILSAPSFYVDISSRSNPFFILFMSLANFMNGTSSNGLALLTLSAGFDACGSYKNYVYIRVKGVKSNDGFVKYSNIDTELDNFLSVTPTDMNVWGNGVVNTDKKLTADRDGVKWSYDKNYVDFDEETGQVIGLKPGVTTITAKADGMTAKCTVHLLYKWPQAWVTETNRATSLRKAIGDGFESRKDLAKGTEVTVYGDSGMSDGWAFACYDDGEKEWWGHIPIADVSTKGTISQYNNMTTTIIDKNGKEKNVPWVWPVNDTEENTKAKYISSPYGWRDTDPSQHKGIDITNGISSNENLSKSIDGYEVVSAFAGTVIYVYDISSGYKSCGNCVAIRSNEKDPITGKHFVAIYMHLKSGPKVSENQSIPANKFLGYVGNTGNSGGSHLHFEVNNQNLSYGQKKYYDSGKEMVFGSVINPLFFYMRYYNLPENNSNKIMINPTCDAMNYRKPLWYGDDIKESKKP